MTNQSSRTRGLKPFKKGQSGNPAGRPKGLSITALVRAGLQEPISKGSTVTRAQAVAEKVLSLAEAGDKAMIQLVWAYVDGGPVSKQETGEPGSFDLADVDSDTLRAALKRVK